jgi:hypothetical protein
VSLSWQESLIVRFPDVSRGLLVGHHQATSHKYRAGSAQEGDIGCANPEVRESRTYLMFVIRTGLVLGF